MGSKGDRLPRFTCLRCVHCCFFSSYEEAPTVFPWERRELEDLAEKLNVGKLCFEPLEAYIDGNGVCAVTVYRWLIKGFCPFYRLASSKCIIHDVKPLACRMYPLILNVETGEVMVSIKCDWVEQYMEQLKSLSGDVETLLKVFPKEGEAAIEALILYREMVKALEELGLKKVSDLASCRELIDADDYVARYG